MMTQVLWLHRWYYYTVVMTTQVLLLLYRFWGYTGVMITQLL